VKFTGEFVVDGTPEEVWPYFNDPAILEDCTPGCKELVLETPSEFRASLAVGVGSVKPSFEVIGVVVECDEPNRLELQASGEASRNSFDVTAWQELTDNGDGTTTVTWQADAEVSGVIASLGERALESVTNKLVTDFFEDIEDHVVAGTPAEARFRAAGEEELQAAAEASAAAREREGDLLDDLLALLGSVRGGTGGEADGPATDGLGRSVAAGAAGGVVGVLLWSRLRSDGAAGDGNDDAAVEASGREDGGGGLRYLLVGIVLGVVGKVLWDAYSSEEAFDEGVERVHDHADGVTEQAEEPATARGNGSDAPTDDTAEEGMIDDPLDRLN